MTTGPATPARRAAAVAWAALGCGLLACLTARPAAKPPPEELTFQEGTVIDTAAAARARAAFEDGEAARARFEALRLDPSSAGAEDLAARLDEKSTLLLAAQERYLAAIREGDAGWAVAAGSRIGALYEDLHRALVDAPLPAGMDGGAADAYRGELRQRVRVLVTKAIEAYEETLGIARRSGVRSADVPRVEEGLGRMRRVLQETDAEG
jgi:hypothetical protein